MTESLVRNKNGSVVGTMTDRVFRKAVYGHLHMLRKPLAWAIDCDIFDKVIKPNCLSIKVTDRDNGHVYTAGVKTFEEKCHKINRKFGDQYYLEIIYWNLE